MRVRGRPLPGDAPLRRWMALICHGNFRNDDVLSTKRECLALDNRKASNKTQEQERDEEFDRPFDVECRCQVPSRRSN